MSMRPAPAVFAREGRLLVAFSPGGGAETLVVQAIKQAKKTLHVQAYEFSSQPICDAVIAAHRNDVEVFVLLDKNNKVNPLSKWFNPVGKSSLLPALVVAGVPVLFDRSPTIAHNKIVVVDSKIVVTGSYNFSHAADATNTENLLVLHDTKVAAVYEQNFAWRKSLSS